MSRDPTGHASSSRIPGSDSRAEADVGTVPNCPPAEDTDMLSATNLEVESAMNHWAVLYGGIFSKRRSMPSIPDTPISALLKMDLLEKHTSM